MGPTAVSARREGGPTPEGGHPEVRVLIIDDHKLFAEAVGSVLASRGMTILGVATSGEEALAAIRRDPPDLVLVDLGLPDARGVEVGRRILDENPDIKVLALTGLKDPRAVGESIQAGFHGYLTKDTPIPRFVDSIEAALGGQVVIPHRLAGAAAGSKTAEERHAQLLADQLTQREVEVLELLVEARSSQAIARALSVSPNTVRTHVQNILSKLQAHSRLEAATFAVRFGIVKVRGQGPHA